MANAPHRLVLFAFDAPFLNGEDIRDTPLEVLLKVAATLTSRRKLVPESFEGVCGARSTCSRERPCDRRRRLARLEREQPELAAALLRHLALTAEQRTRN